MGGPCYSLDSVHGGCPDILTAIDSAIVAANRRPDAILSGHVHNYQRFSREIDNARMPYIVAGAGGYANTPQAMHHLQKIDTSKPYQTTHPDVRLETSNQKDPGFLTITATDQDLTFDYYTVPFDGSAPKQVDSVTV